MEHSDIANTILTFFNSEGYSPEQSCGIISNIQCESNFDILAIGDGGSAKGLFQMHLSRRFNIKQATEINMANASVIDQCKGCLWELENNERRANEKLKSASSAYDAGFLFCRYYERPAANTEWNKRGNIAEEWYKYFLD